MIVEEEDDEEPGSPTSSAPPQARGVSMSASALSENPVFKRARGEKVLVGAHVGTAEEPMSRPISTAELEMKFFANADGAESVCDDDADAETGKKKKSKKKDQPESSRGLNADQLDALVEDAAFGGTSKPQDDNASESEASSVVVQNAPRGPLRLNGVTCVACALAASMNPVEEFLCENLGKLSDEAIYRNAAEIYERDIAGPARREGAETPRIPWKFLQVHYEQHSLDPIIQRHTELRALQKMRTMLTLGACRDDGSGHVDLDMAKSNQTLKIMREERGLRQELEDLRRNKKK